MYSLERNLDAASAQGGRTYVANCLDLGQQAMGWLAGSLASLGLYQTKESPCFANEMVPNVCVCVHQLAASVWCHIRLLRPTDYRKYYN